MSGQLISARNIRYVDSDRVFVSSQLSHTNPVYAGFSTGDPIIT